MRGQDNQYPDHLYCPIQLTDFDMIENQDVKVKILTISLLKRNLPFKKKVEQNKGKNF